MTSSMATGERRWASARRGGMTVLGKVAVPKPINLPSQRLENHGMDPNLEIVPKGTLSWGSRPSSSGSNAWGTSGLSPRTDGSSSSPTHFGGRPSSGGGTRPLTAGSEKGYDSNANAWGSTSRPSSASGISASNNSSLASLRPHSADTRPGSSQLSRFAEPSAENSVSQGSTATSERMIIATAGNDGFSLTSGDFPTLGSEKDESGKETDPSAHGRPGSASARVSTIANNVETAHGDEIPRNADIKDNSWRKDSHPYAEDGVRPSMETWRGEHQSYPNHNMAHPHFESWRGAPPVNPQGGVWYRGPLGPPPYGGPPGAPGGFPMDPYPYYRPQVPPGGGTHGHHSKNGDMYRPPPMSDSYMRPGMPIRPGFYPGPVPYESYYGPPPMGFCNPNERDLSFMGMPPGPSIYNNRPLNPNGLDPNPNGPDPNHFGPPIYNNRPINTNGPDPNHSGPRSREHRGPDQIESGANDPRGNYKILTKQNDRYDQNDGERWGHRMSGGVPNREKGILSKSSIPDNAWGGDYRKDRENTWEGDHKDKDLHYGKHAEVDMRFSHPGRNVNELDACPVGDNAPSPSDHSLIQKIEGLNAKARSSEGRRDNFHREQPREKMHIVNSKDNRSSNQASSNALLERNYTSGVTPVARDTTIEKSRETTASSGTATSRSIRGVQSRSDTQGRRRFNGHESDGLIKKSESQTSSSVVSGSTTNDEVPKADAEKKSGRGSVILTSDLSDTQRAKMREIARQRAIQLQKEEEERIREQKAKALAKLEELDRRSGANQGLENLTQKSESCPSQSVVPQEQPEPSLDGNQRDWPSSVSSSNIGQTNERTGNDNFNPAVSYLQVGAVVMKIESKDSISSQNQSQEANPKVGDGKGDGIAPQVREASKQKRVSHKQRQNIASEKNSVQDSNGIGVAEEASGSLDLPVHQKKKNNKSGKNKHKGDESLIAVSLSEAIPNDSRISQAICDAEGKKASDSNINPSSKDLVQSSEDHSSLPREDAHDRQNNSRKSQHSWKPRNSQSNNKVSEKSHVNDASVVWAPVRSHNKFEVPGDLVPSEPGISMPRNNSKTKRAEMERYVPKPVAKELAQQESIVQEGTTEERLKSSEFSDHVAKVGSPAESKNVPKQQKAQGSWRQRLPTEETHVQSSKDSSTPDETLVGGMRSRPDEHSEKGSPVSMDDGWNITNDSNSTSSAAFSGMKTRDSSGKGKRHPVKGYRRSGYNQNFDHKDSNTALVNSQLETSQAERITFSKENRDRSTSHWLPKSQGNSVQGHPNQASTVEIESATSEPSNVLNEQRPFSGSGYRKNTNYGGRFRGQETPQENKHQHSSSVNPGRQRQNSHFEYQPVGPYNNNNRSNDSGSQKDDQPQPGGQRFRERGNNYSRRGGRGNFYGNANDGGY